MNTRRGEGFQPGEKRKILVVLHVETSEPVPDEGVAEEVIDAINETGRHCEYPFRATLRSVQGFCDCPDPQEREPRVHLPNCPRR